MTINVIPSHWFPSAGTKLRRWLSALEIKVATDKPFVFRAGDHRTSWQAVCACDLDPIATGAWDEVYMTARLHEHVHRSERSARR